MQILIAKEFLILSKSLPIVDVRSPAEFAEGHIPRAINIPIFDNEEREIVGTIYKNKGRLPAIEKGLEIVGAKMAEFVRKANSAATSGQLLVYCWRGGMRSESMAWLFERVGINCYILEGGYKSYRNYLLDNIGNLPHLIVIEGHTGSGKTEILLQLRAMGEQVIDLEGNANHRGSVFGGIGQKQQPTTQQFQNKLFDQVIDFDLLRRVWIEGESQKVGRVFIPDPLWQKMNEAKCIEIQVPTSDRIIRLVANYGFLPEDQIENAIGTIAKRIGDLRVKEIFNLYRSKKFMHVAEKLLEYYDQTYQFSREKYKKKLTEIVLPNGDAKSNAQIILEKSISIFYA